MIDLSDGQVGNILCHPALGVGENQYDELPCNLVPNGNSNRVNGVVQMNIAELCLSMDSRGASDLFITSGKSPSARIDGAMSAASTEPVDDASILSFLEQYLPSGLVSRWDSLRDLDLGVSLTDSDRFRLNLSFQRNRRCMAIRRVPSGALDFDALKLPDALRKLAASSRGLVLVTGATGSGKSTTMAAMLHYINSTFARHIVTIEDPIEFFHQDLRSVVSQREIGSDTLDFGAALRHVVRQNPDVIFIGEMRDFETIQTAISAAMTGHLVVSTMHTVDVTHTLERIINYFPDTVRDQMAQDLSLALVGIVSQRLLPRKNRSGRVPVFEILVATPLARRLIAERELEGMEEVLKSGTAEGMCTFTRSLLERVKGELLDVQTAAGGATNRDEFLLAAQGMETGIDTLRYRDSERGRGLSMKKLLRDALKYGASDLLLTAGSPPVVRLHGQLRAFDMPVLTPGDSQQLLFSILNPAQRATFERDREIDFALTVSGMKSDEERDTSQVARFRVNGYYQKGSVASAFRSIPRQIASPDELRIPPVVMKLAQRHQGLILVTGPTGHGKSTTLACIINSINQSRACHIVTVEDPIEFVHENQQAVIDQREVHSDTRSFVNALKYVLRQDPDVILVGEMRDPETISAALTAAETGHLVLATLHTNDAAQTVDRIIDVFPADRQNQVRYQLAASLEAIIAQRLLPRSGSREGRIPAFEIMLASDAVRAQIREQRTHQLAATIETSGKDGMITMDRAARDLFNAGLITRETLLSVSRGPLSEDEAAR